MVDLHTGRRLDVVDRFRPALDDFMKVYEEIHQYPELTLQEQRTAKRAAEHLRSQGFEVVEGIGGHGVVGVLHNGDGKTVLLRADMDALPIKEETGLLYASKEQMLDVVDGKKKPVMHACGHDMHVATLMAAASCISAAHEKWKGTLICLFQPAEEGGGGAQSMVEDGLYNKIPRPDILLAQHVTSRRAGIVAIRPGPVLSATDTWQVRILGRGGHGSEPQRCVDPIVVAAHILVRIQSIISREVRPGSIAILTCGSLHGGDKDNIIPDHADMTLNLRTYETVVRERVLTALRRVINGECEAAGCPDPPIIEEVESLPSVVNDAVLTEQLQSSFEDSFGNEVQSTGRVMASEDFPLLALQEIPYVYWHLGCIDHAKWDDAESKGELDKIPGNHSSGFAPAAGPTLRRGVDALAVAALTFLGIS